MPLDVLGRTRATLTGPAGRAFAPAPRPRGAGQSRQAPSCWGQSVAIVALERGIPSRRGSSARADYVPALCTHRPSLLPIGRPGEASGPAGGRSATTARGREAVRTWSPRGSKSRNKVSVGEPAEGSLQGGAGPPRPANSFSSFSSPSAALNAATALQETSSEFFFRPPGEVALPALPREGAPGAQAQPPATDLLAPASMKNAATCDTWCELQEPSEPSSLRTHIAPAGNPAGLPVRAPPQSGPRPAPCGAALAPAAAASPPREPKFMCRASREVVLVSRRGPRAHLNLPPRHAPGAAFVPGEIARRSGRRGEEVGGRPHARPQASASDRAGLPAELKHISKRRKRNQPGLPQ